MPNYHTAGGWISAFEQAAHDIQPTMPGAAVQAEVCTVHEGCVVVTHDPLLQHVTWKDHDPVDVAKAVLKP